MCGHRQQGCIFTRCAIHMKAKQLIAHKSFHASAGWCTRFMNRNHLVIRQKTKICQRLPADLEEKIISFQRFVIKERQSHSYPLSQIENIYKTPTLFYLPSNRIVDCVGSKTITVRTIGHEKLTSPRSLRVWQMVQNFHQWPYLKEKQCPKISSRKASSFMCIRKAGWTLTVC